MYYAGMQWFAIICLEFHFQNLPSFTWMSAALLYTQSNLLFFSILCCRKYVCIEFQLIKNTKQYF